MYRLNKVLALCCVILPLSVFGQNYYNTPYSKFLLGDQITSGFSYNRSLGGSGIALRPHNQINYLNPAAYTSQDTNSFLFQVGAAERIVNINTKLSEDKTYNMNIEFLALGFPVTRWWKFSAGLLPYSRMQYYFTQTPIDTETDYVKIDYTGNGGLNEFYFGSAFKITDYLSIGANASYLFGPMTKKHTIDLPFEPYGVSSTYIFEEYVVSGFYYKLGLQAEHTFNDKHHFIFGSTFDPKTKIHLTKTSLETRNFHSSGGGIYQIDTIKYLSDSNYYKSPVKFGLGLTYIYDNRLLVTFDYIKQSLIDGSIFDENENLKDYNSFRFGAGFTPVELTSRKRSSYFGRMHYRVGAHYTNTYLKISGSEINDYGFSVGLGLPWRNAQKLYTFSTFNITYEYGIRGTLDNGLIKEKYQLITLGLTLHDFWFFKSKYD